jgi:hypothetical protein
MEISMLIAGTAAFAAFAFAAEPIRLHPDNPHYFQFRGKPTVMITSAEHYGAVLNGAFDYTKYLDTLAADGLNMTRVFSGVYREDKSDFGIRYNTLAPSEQDYISPWVRFPNGGYDLKAWNPAYFARLKDFVAQAGKRGIIVEYVLFCNYYRDHHWRLSPFYQAGRDVPRGEVQTMKHAALLALQEAFVKKIAAELKDFDNLYYEICNEPYFGVANDWQAHIAKVLAAAEAGFPTRHMIAQNIANHQQLVTNPDPNVQLLNFHYARPPVTVGMNYHLDRAIGLDETGFDGTLDAVYRIQAWDFLIAGGAHYNNLDYSFAVGHEDGALPVGGDQPGGGGPALRRQLKTLHQVMAKFDFLKMKPDPHLVSGGAPEGASVTALSEPGRQYAVYLHHGRVMSNYRPRYIVNVRPQKTALTLQLPPGKYTAAWWNPRTGKIDHTEAFEHQGSGKTLAAPAYSEDVALELKVH